MRHHTEAPIKLDRTVFFVSSAIVFIIVFFMFVYPEQTKSTMNLLLHTILNDMGFVYTWAGILAIAGCLYFSFSKYGKIKFGEPDEKPEFNNFTWAATLFTAGIAAAILYWAPIEWTNYYQEPALGVTPNTWQAAEWAQAYSFFHWGAIPWALYSICALPIGYSYFTRKKPVLKISETCRDVIGKHADGFLGKLIDILFIIAIIMGTTTELGTATPLISAAICTLFRVEPIPLYNYIVLGTTTAIFALAAYFGLKKGLTKLGNANYILAIVILLFVFIAGPTVFIIKMATTSTGLFFQNFLQMATWMDPVGNSGFVESWTQFYWAWWMSYGLFMGMFIARLSRGRTIRNVLLGSIFWGSIGCGTFFWILGGFTMDLHFSGALDVLGLIDLKGTYLCIMECLQQLPFSSLLLAAYALCGVLFLSTTFDAATTGIASISQKNLKIGDDPNRKLIIYWSIVMVLLPTAMFTLNGDFETIQTAVVVGSFPTAFIMILQICSFLKMVKADRYFDRNK